MAISEAWPAVIASTLVHGGYPGPDGEEGFVSFTWPEKPGPNDWYLEIVPEKASESKFNAVWIVLKCMAFPKHVCDYAAVNLKGNMNFKPQFDTSLRCAMEMVRRLNLEGFRSEVEEEVECDSRCGNCGAPACDGDYLCEGCRDAR